MWGYLVCIFVHFQTFLPSNLSDIHLNRRLFWSKLSSSFEGSSTKFLFFWPKNYWPINEGKVDEYNGTEINGTLIITADFVHPSCSHSYILNSSSLPRWTQVSWHMILNAYRWVSFIQPRISHYRKRLSWTILIHVEWHVL